MSTSFSETSCETCQHIKQGEVGICPFHGIARLDEHEIKSIRSRLKSKFASAFSPSSTKIPDGYRLAEEWQPKLTKQSAELLQEIKRQRGLKDLDALVKAFAESAGGKPIPEASTEILRNTRPCCITGLPRSGKTLTTREIIKSAVDPVFVIDMSDEYPDLQKLSFSQVFSLDWHNAKGQYRFVPMTAITEMSKKEVEIMFDWFQMMKGDGRFRRWIFVLEEGHRFKGISSVQNFIGEGRKFTLLILVVSFDWEAYEPMCDLFRPFSKPEASLLTG